MQVYVGQTRGGHMLETLTKLGFGEMTVLGELPPRRHPWAFDNGAYRDFKAGRPFDPSRFMFEIVRIQGLPVHPDFVVSPDIVGGGIDSLRRSIAWEQDIRQRVQGKLYVAVQEGIEPVDSVLQFFDGIFVGGASSEWKVRTGPEWVALAHRLGKTCHIGRCGSNKMARWAKRIGADSIDSCLPLWSRENLDRFVRAVEYDESKDSQLRLAGCDQ